MKNKFSIGFVGALALFLIVTIPQSAFAQSSTNSCERIETRDFVAHVTGQINNRINSSDNPDVVLPLYSKRSDKPESTWVRNPNAWVERGANPIDFTGVSGWNNKYDNSLYDDIYVGGATLITPRHFVAATHRGFDIGNTISFFDKNGKRVDRTIVGLSRVSSTDIQIGLLDTDVDNSITNYQLISTSDLLKLVQKTQADPLDVPIGVLNQDAKVIVRSMSDLNNINVRHDLYNFGSISRFSGNLRNGDSGQPAFIIIDGKAVLLFVNYGTDNGFALGSYISDINKAIMDMENDGGYRVSVYNTACFDKSEPIPITMGFSSRINNFKACYSGNNKDKVVLSWSALTDPVDHYVLVVDKGAIVSLPASATSFTHYPIVPGTDHTYTIRATRTGYNSSGSIWSIGTIKNIPLCSTAKLQGYTFKFNPTIPNVAMQSPMPNPPSINSNAVVVDNNTSKIGNYTYNRDATPSTSPTASASPNPVVKPKEDKPSLLSYFRLPFFGSSPSPAPTFQATPSPVTTVAVKPPVRVTSNTPVYDSSPVPTPTSTINPVSTGSPNSRLPQVEKITPQDTTAKVVYTTPSPVANPTVDSNSNNGSSGQGSSSGGSSSGTYVGIPYNGITQSGVSSGGQNYNGVSNNNYGNNSSDYPIADYPYSSGTNVQNDSSGSIVKVDEQQTDTSDAVIEDSKSFKRYSFLQFVKDVFSNIYKGMKRTADKAIHIFSK